MKRTSLLFALALSAQIVFAQLPIDEKTQKITYQELVNIEMSAQLIQARATKFARDHRWVIKSNEKGKLICEGFVMANYASVKRGITEHAKIRFRFSLLVKDGAYKYKLTNFTHTAAHKNCGPLESETSECDKYQIKPGVWDSIKSQTATNTTKLLDGFKQKIIGEVEVVEEVDTW